MTRRAFILSVLAGCLPQSGEPSREQTRRWVGVAYVAGTRRCTLLQRSDFTVYRHIRKPVQ